MTTSRLSAKRRIALDLSSILDTVAARFTAQRCVSCAGMTQRNKGRGLGWLVDGLGGLLVCWAS